VIKRLLPALAATLLLSAGCSSSSQPAASTTSSSAGQETMNVYADATQYVSFTQIGEQGSGD
jgi:molybdate transport system substrate-binding protein